MAESSRVPHIPEIVPENWETVRRFSRDVGKYLRTLAKSDQTLYLADMYLTSSTASRLLATDASQKMVSTALASWVTGTSNQITVVDGSGSITLSTPQDIHTGASPVFTGLTLSSFTLGSVLFAGVSGVLSQDNANLFWDDTNKYFGLGTNTPTTNLHMQAAPPNTSPYSQIHVEGSSSAGVKAASIGLTSHYNSTSDSWFIGAGDGTDNNNNFRIVALTTTHRDIVNLDVAAADGTLIVNASSQLGVGVTPNEKLEVAGKIRANTAFNLNGTDGISNSAVGIITASTVNGGIITAVTKNDWMDQSVKVAAQPTFTGVVSEKTATANNSKAGDFTLTFDASVGDVGYAYGGHSKLTVIGSNNVTNNVMAQGCIVQSNGTGSATLAKGLMAQVQSVGGGTITAGYSLYASGSYITGVGSTVTTAGGLYIEAQAKAGVTNAYGIRQVGASDINNFVGKCKFGTAGTPSEQVHASDTVRADTFFNHNGTDGVTTTFTNGDGATVTVSGGIITSIV